MSMACVWCEATALGPRLGTLLCRDCFDIQQNIGDGIRTWRTRRIQFEIMPRLREALSTFTVYESDEVIDSLQKISEEWSESWFNVLLSDARPEGNIP